MPLSTVGAPSVVAKSHTPPSLAVDAETPGVVAAVEEIARLLLAAGATLDPGLIVLERSGHVTLASQDDVSGKAFIDLPTATLIPTDHLVWDDTSTDVTVVAGHESLTDLQRELLDLHIALWNATGKRRHFLDHHPRATTEAGSELAVAIGEIRPGFVPSATTATLLRTRTFGLSQLDTTKSSVIMPILELADHHPQGAPYRLSDGGLGAQYRHVDDTAITYVRYGPARDAIDLACHYGFATNDPEFAISAPLSLDLEGFGDLDIKRTLNRRAAAQWSADSEGLVINYLALDPRVGLYESLFLPVRKYVESRGAGSEMARNLAMRACHTVIQLNKELVLSLGEHAIANGTGGGDILAAAAEHQWQLLDAVETLG